jgi:hypothetical protein
MIQGLTGDFAGFSLLRMQVSSRFFECVRFFYKKVKRLLMRSHYPFVANAASRVSQQRICWPERESGQQYLNRYFCAYPTSAGIGRRRAEASLFGSRSKDPAFWAPGLSY